MKGRRREEGGRVEKGGGSGCCNTATYSTGEEALAVDGERGNNYTNNYAIIKLFWKLFWKLFAHY